MYTGYKWKGGMIDWKLQQELKAMHKRLKEVLG